MEGAGDFCGGSGFMGIECTTGTLYTCTGLGAKATVKTACGSLCMQGDVGKDHCMGSIWKNWGFKNMKN
jgi:hypothetical protein